VKCTKLDFGKGSDVPSTRWGHSAAVHDDKVFILGGRNDRDISDLHSLDTNTMKWSKIELHAPIPKPRRRHSAIFISNSLLMFGGFDGEFYNDLHILNLNKNQKRKVFVSKSTLDSDYKNLVNEPEHSNLTFVLDTKNGDGNGEVIHANKALVLFRIVERELRTQFLDQAAMSLDLS